VFSSDSIVYAYVVVAPHKEYIPKSSIRPTKSLCDKFPYTTETSRDRPYLIYNKTPRNNIVKHVLSRID